MADGDERDQVQAGQATEGGGTATKEPAYTHPLTLKALLSETEENLRDLKVDQDATTANIKAEEARKKQLVGLIKALVTLLGNYEEARKGFREEKAALTKFLAKQESRFAKEAPALRNLINAAKDHIDWLIGEKRAAKDATSAAATLARDGVKVCEATVAGLETQFASLRGIEKIIKDELALLATLKEEVAETDHRCDSALAFYVFENEFRTRLSNLQEFYTVDELQTRIERKAKELRDAQQDCLEKKKTLDEAELDFTLANAAFDKADNEREASIRKELVKPNNNFQEEE